MSSPGDHPPPDSTLWNPSPPGPSKTNGLAIASLVLGILWLFWLGSVLALIFGYVGKSQIDRSGGRESGGGLAIAGIVLGWVGIGLLVVTIAVGLIIAPSDLGSEGSTDDTDQVEQVLDRYAVATRDKDYQTICNDLYASRLVEQSRAAGVPCEVALRTGLEDRQDPDLEVLDVEVNRDLALARVRSTAGGEAPATDVVRLVKENGDWRVASLSDPGAAGSP